MPRDARSGAQPPALMQPREGPEGGLPGVSEPTWKFILQLPGGLSQLLPQGAEMSLPHEALPKLQTHVASKLCGCMQPLCWGGLLCSHTKNAPILSPPHASVWQSNDTGYEK